MLNEKYEYEQYTAPLNGYVEKYGKRLQYSNIITNSKPSGYSLSGFTRPLTIIARANLERPVREIRNVLKDWCQGWFMDYIDQIVMPGLDGKDSAKKKLEIAKTAFLGRISEFEKSQFNVRDIDVDNDIKRVTFDRIIANALDMGSLKNYCLVATGCETEEEAFEGISYGSKCITTESKTNGKKHKNTVLKVTAAFLLAQKRAGRDCTGAIDSEIVSITDLGNWMQKKAEKGRMEGFAYAPGSSPEKTPLYEFRPLFDDKTPVTVAKFNMDWIRSCGWKLVEGEFSDYVNALIYHEGPGGLSYTESTHK